MAIVGEPCNVDAHANIIAPFMTLLCLWLCVRFVYTWTVHTDCNCTVVSLNAKDLLVKFGCQKIDE